jgi:hypothetical protein
MTNGSFEKYLKFSIIILFNLFYLFYRRYRTEFSIDPEIDKYQLVGAPLATGWRFVVRAHVHWGPLVLRAC